MQKHVFNLDVGSAGAGFDCCLQFLVLCRTATDIVYEHFDVGVDLLEELGGFF